MDEKDQREENIETQPLPDLQINDEHAEETKGGTGFLAYGDYRGGVQVGAGD